MVQKLFLLALAGSIGTLARYGLVGYVQRLTGAAFPWGTLVANLTGCFLAGLFFTLFEYRVPVSGQTRAIVLVGFMGAFTTFSAYILETGNLARDTEWLFAAGNMLLQNSLGIVALFLGIVLARAL